MSEDRQQGSLFGHLSWAEEPPAPETGKERVALERELERERARADRERVRAQRGQARAEGKPVGLLALRRVVTAVVLTVCGIQVVIWALISIIGQEFTFPWWLYTSAGGGAVIGLLWLITAMVSRKRRAAHT